MILIKYLKFRDNVDYYTALDYNDSQKVLDEFFNESEK